MAWITNIIVTSLQPRQTTYTWRQALVTCGDSNLNVGTAALGCPSSAARPLYPSSSRFLERRRHREPERLPRLSQLETRRVNIHRLAVGVIARRTRREHATRNRNWRICQRVESQRVVCPINAEGRIHHRQEHLQLQTSGNPWLPVRRAQHLQILRRHWTQCLSSRAVVAGIECRATERGA